MLRKAKNSQAEPVPVEVSTCVSDMITRLECSAIVVQHAPRAADPRSQAVLQTLQQTRDRMALEAAFEAGRRGREMLEAAKQEVASEDV
eukprot:COSAG02_NODE_6363_length_3623_cov_7.028377_3_plen_89_part_00